MQWWAWAVVALAIIVLLVVAVLAVQWRRRRGGVIAEPVRRASTGRTPTGRGA
jgi:hypothetical protein